LQQLRVNTGRPQMVTLNVFVIFCEKMKQKIFEIIIKNMFHTPPTIFEQNHWSKTFLGIGCALLRKDSKSQFFFYKNNFNKSIMVTNRYILLML
jgi:hypothetical protein